MRRADDVIVVAGYWAAMSRENVERHRSAVDAVNRRDLDALLAIASGEVQAEYDPASGDTLVSCENRRPLP